MSTSIDSEDLISLFLNWLDGNEIDGEFYFIDHSIDFPDGIVKETPVMYFTKKENNAENTNI